MWPESELAKSLKVLSITANMAPANLSGKCHKVVWGKLLNYESSAKGLHNTHGGKIMIIPIVISTVDSQFCYCKSLKVGNYKKNT